MWDDLAGEAWQSRRGAVDLALLKDIRKRLAKRTFGDRGADAALVVHDAAVMAVNPQIGHAVRAVWEPAHRRDDREDRGRSDVEKEGTTDRAHDSAAPVRSGAAWASTGLALAILSAAVFGQSALIRSDAFLLTEPAAIVFSAATMLVSFVCLYRYDRGVAAGTMQRWELLPARHLVIAVILYALACVLAVARIVIHPGDLSVLVVAAFALQCVVLVGSIALLSGRGGDRRSGRTETGTAGSGAAGSGEKYLSGSRTLNATDGAARTSDPSGAAAAELDAHASSARQRERALLERLPRVDRETIVSLQLHVLRELLLADRLTPRGVAEAIATVRERWGD